MFEIFLIEYQKSLARSLSSWKRKHSSRLLPCLWVGTPKDYIEKIDFQLLIFAMSTGQIRKCTGHLSVQHASLASLLQLNSPMFSWLQGVGFCRFWFKIQDFMGVFGPWVTYSWRRKKFITRIYKIIPIFTPPMISDWRKLGWRGMHTVLSSRL